MLKDNTQGSFGTFVQSFCLLFLILTKLVASFIMSALTTAQESIPPNLAQTDPTVNSISSTTPTIPANAPTPAPGPVVRTVADCFYCLLAWGRERTV